MGRPRLYADDSEKKAAYRKRLRKRVGIRAYRQAEAEKKAAYRSRVANASPSTNTNSAKSADTDQAKLDALCDAVAGAREEFGRSFSTVWTPRLGFTSVGLVTLLEKIEAGLRGTKPRSPRLRKELAALSAQCGLVREELGIELLSYAARWKSLDNLELAYQCASIEDRLCELAGRKKAEQPEFQRASATANVNYLEYREKLQAQTQG